MFGFEHEVVVFVRSQKPGNLSTEAFFLKTMRDLMAEIRTPSAKIIIHVDGWNACFRGPGFQMRDIFCGRQRVMQEFVPFRKIQVVDDIDEK